MLDKQLVVSTTAQELAPRLFTGLQKGSWFCQYKLDGDIVCLLKEKAGKSKKKKGGGEELWYAGGSNHENLGVLVKKGLLIPVHEQNKIDH